MKYIILFLSFNLLAAENCSHDKQTFRCVKYLRNYDGDTITVTIPNTHPLLGKKAKIRVNNVDTPEIRTRNKCEKKMGRNAKRLVENILKRAKRIDLENVQRGKYFRIVADVKVDGKDLGQTLLKNGLAYRYGGGKKKKVDWCRRAVANKSE